MAALGPGAGLVAEASVIGVILMIITGVGFWWGESRADYETGVGCTADLPVPCHIGGRRLTDCTICRR